MVPICNNKSLLVLNIILNGHFGQFTNRDFGSVVNSIEVVRMEPVIFSETDPDVVCHLRVTTFVDVVRSTLRFADSLRG